jgi:hypothetical protein
VNAGWQFSAFCFVIFTIGSVYAAQQQWRLEFRVSGLGFFIVTNGSVYTAQQQRRHHGSGSRIPIAGSLTEFIFPAAIAYIRILQNNNDYQI